jgi:hypothetical protein
VTRGRLAVHGHFYQPDRRDPFTGEIPPQLSAAPAHDWTERITNDCYRPNAERGNFGRVGWDLGPTLATWLRARAPEVHAAIARQETGNGMAQAWHHSILPLASMRDRRTEIRWGMRDFELRFGRRATGMWFPETAIDLPTLRIAAEEGVAYAILAPWQAGTDGNLDTRRPYRVEVGGGRSMVVAFYDRALSSAISFEPDASTDADRFARDRVRPRVTSALPGGIPPLVIIATDGELYGHHQPFRDLFLERLTDRVGASIPDPGFDITTVGHLLGEARRQALPIMTIRERTSWSCHHGVVRWYGACGCAADGSWKQPLRAAFDRLAAGIDIVSERLLQPLAVDMWDARDAYVDVAAGFADPDGAVERAFTRALDGAPARAARLAADRGASRIVRDVLAAQSSRLAMFASDAWYWDDPARPETAQVLRVAAHAARLIDAQAGTAFERELVADLAAVRSPTEGVDGTVLYRRALEEVGQSGVAA